MKWFWIGICILLVGSFGSNGHIDPSLDDMAVMEFVPGVYIYTQEDYRRQAHQELVAAHGIIDPSLDDMAVMEFVPGVYIYTQEDYRRQAHQELVAAHGILKTEITRAVKLLLQNAIERSEPEPFDMGVNDIDPGFYNEIPIEAWRYYYKIRVNGEWQYVTKDEYNSKLDVARKRNKQRISDMKSLLKELEK